MGDAEASGSDLGAEPLARQGWVAPHIAAEFPGLGIAWVELESKRANSPEPVRRRLRDLSDRFYGSHAIHMRERPIPWAYRVFFRQIGLDPDHTRTPVEQLALDRLHDGAFVSRGMPADALTIATVETGVALRVFDTDQPPGRALHPRLGAGRVTAGQAHQARPGNPDDRRRSSPAGASLRWPNRQSRPRL